MDFMKKKIQGFIEEVVELRKELASMKTESRELKKGNGRLWSKLQGVKREVREFEQYSRRGDLEIEWVK